ncbi:MAG: deoxyhypusine synthase family protein [Magnetococcales bacterium]|nr:deoxyhypusine synthase family protein [Magnetococcales bacterium]
MSQPPVDGRDPRRYHNPGAEGMKPVLPLDLSRIQTVDDLVRAMSQASFGARRLGEAAEVLEAMVKDPECFTVLTLSGAMTVAKMGLVICEMIERGYVNAIISTGALMTHGVVENSGGHHFKCDPYNDDAALYAKGYNRVYDTIEPESNLDQAADLVVQVLSRSDLPPVLSSHFLTRAIGEHICATQPEARGPLTSAYRHGVPIVIPALTDSEMGLDLAVHNHRLRHEGRPALEYNPFIDLEYYTGLTRGAKRLGIFTIGGGVPRNYAQQVGPYFEILGHRMHTPPAQVRFQYGVRICPEPEHLGGLSGCTYREGISWGKFVPPAAGGRYAEVFADATIAWPLIVKAVMERYATKATL